MNNSLLGSDTFKNTPSYFRNPRGLSYIVQEVIHQILKQQKSTLIVDGGYNKGAWSKSVLKNNASARILGIEASQATFAQYQKECPQGVTLLNYGLDDTDTTVSLANNQIPGDRSFSLQYASSHPNESVDLSLVRLDTLLKDYDFSDLILKLDIEGYESRAIHGAEDVLDRTNILLWERHSKFMGKLTGLLDDILYLEQKGFDVYIIGSSLLRKPLWIKIGGNQWNDVYDIAQEHEIPFRPSFPVYLLGGYRPRCINLVGIKPNIFHQLSNAPEII